MCKTCGQFSNPQSIHRGGKLVTAKRDLRPFPIRAKFQTLGCLHVECSCATLDAHVSLEAISHAYV